MRLLYLPWWFFKVRFLGKKAPLQTVLFISDLCNLKCKHCSVYAKGQPTIKTYDQVERELQASYKKGSRFVDFEGGEPFLWKDGSRNVNDLCLLAKKIGFFSTTITTNAQLPFANSAADSIWVSMDGLSEYHDKIRGEGAFAKMEENIKACGHKHVSVNMVINKVNCTQITAAAEYAKRSQFIEEISFNFHTPFAGTEDLYIDNLEERYNLIDTIIKLKKQSYPIMNSVSALKKMKDLKFKKYCWIAEFILPDGTVSKECVGKTAGVCDKCGFCMSGEMNSVMNLSVDTLKAGLKLRVAK